MKEDLLNYYNEHSSVAKEFFATDCLTEISDRISKALRNGNFIYAFGNGGSAAEASHFIAELTGRFELERKSYAAICLNDNMSIITAIANDYSFEQVFSKQVQAYVKTNDIVIGFSTSGNSKNVNNALFEANKLGAYTVGFTGEKESNIKKIANTVVSVPSSRTCIIQEIHLIAIHYISGQVEKNLNIV